MDFFDSLRGKVGRRGEAIGIVVLFAATQLWGCLTDVRGVLWKNGGRWALAVQAAIVLVGSLVVVVLARRILSPRPKLVDLPANQFAKDFTVLKWDYDAHIPGVTRYEVMVEPGALGKFQRWGRPTQARYMPITYFGRMVVKVRAVAKGKVTRESEPVAISVYKDALDRILKQRRMVIGIHPDNEEGFFCRISSRKNEAGEDEPVYEGLDIRFIDDFRRHLESDGQGAIAVEYLLLKWDEILVEPARRNIDFAIASITIDRNRAAEHRILFSHPYWHSRVAMVYDSARTSLPDDLRDLQNVGVHAETTMTAIVKEQWPNATIVRTNPELFGFLTNGEVEAVVYDEERVLSEQKKHPAWTVLPLDVPVQAYGIAMAPASTDLKAALDLFIGQGASGWEAEARKALGRTVPPPASSAALIAS